jgi:hypothetical protein
MRQNGMSNEAVALFHSTREVGMIKEIGLQPDRDGGNEGLFSRPFCPMGRGGLRPGNEVCIRRHA